MVESKNESLGFDIGSGKDEGDKEGIGKRDSMNYLYLNSI